MTFTEFTNHPFWNFSVTSWQQESVKEICLLLQKRYNLNTNFILLSCFLGYEHVSPLTERSYQHLLTLCTSWHENVVVKLRNVRENIKKEILNPQFTSVKIGLQKKTNEAELLGEAVEQALLYETVRPFLLKNKTTLSQVEIAQKNLEAYLNVEHIILMQNDIHLLQTLTKLILKMAT